MSTKPRTPEHFPRMKHRAAKRRVLYVDILPNIAELVAAFARLTARAERLSLSCKHPVAQPTTEAAPNRAASLMPGRKR